MKPRTALLLSLPILATGLAGGWLLPLSGIFGALPLTGPAAAATSAPAGPATAVTIPGMPEPSGLPGDLIHLEEIRDPRVLHAALLAAEEGDRGPLVQRWEALDPAGVVRFLLLKKMRVAGYFHAEEGILIRWLGKDPAASLRFLAELPEVNAPRLYSINSQDDLEKTMDTRLRDAPGETLGLFRTATLTFKQLICRSVFSHLFSTDSALALAEMEPLPLPLQRQAWSGIYHTKDPAALLKLLDKKKNIACPADLHVRIFETYLNQNPDAARSLAETLPPGPRREAACSVVLKEMASADPDAALAWMEAHAPTRANRKLVYEAVGKKDPGKALELHSQARLPFSNEITRFIETMDEAAAETLAANTPDAWTRSQILRTMAQGVTLDKDNLLPQLAKLSGLLTSPGIGPDLVSLLGHQFRDIPADQLPAVTDWMTRQPDSVREAMLEPMAQRMRREGPETAAVWLAQLPPGEARTEALIQTTSAWAAKDPRAAADFSLNLPPGTDREYAVLNTALAWQHLHPADARQWVDSLPDSPAKTRTLKGLADAATPH